MNFGVRRLGGGNDISYFFELLRYNIHILMSFIFIIVNCGIASFETCKEGIRRFGWNRYVSKRFQKLKLIQLIYDENVKKTIWLKHFLGILFRI